MARSLCLLTLVIDRDLAMGLLQCEKPLMTVNVQAARHCVLVTHYDEMHPMCRSFSTTLQ